MKDEVGINKQHLFQCRQIQGSLDVCAEGRGPKRAPPTGRAGIHSRALENHLGSQNPKRSMETLLEEALDGCPPLIQEPLKGGLG